VVKEIRSRQLAHYHRNRDRINAARRARRKAIVKPLYAPKTADGTTDYNTVKPPQPPSPSWRIHKAVFDFKLVEPIRSSQPAEVALSRGLKYKPIFMRGHTDAILLDFELKARLYPTTLTIYAEELEMPMEAKLADLIGLVYDRVEKTVWAFERIVGIRTRKLDRGMLLARLTQQHIALKDHPLAEFLRLNGTKLCIADPDGGEPLLIIDFSHGHDEVESLNVLKGEFVMNRINDLSKAVALGEFDYRQEHDLLMGALTAIRGLAESESAIKADIQYIARNMSTHIPFMQYTLQTAKGIKARKPQAQDPCQRRL